MDIDEELQKLEELNQSIIFNDSAECDFINNNSEKSENCSETENVNIETDIINQKIENDNIFDDDSDDDVNVIVPNIKHVEKEITELIKNSIKTRSNENYINIFINSDLICVGSQTVISTTLQNLLWRRCYTDTHNYKIIRQELLEKILQNGGKHYNNETIAFFGAIFEKPYKQFYKVYKEFSIVVVKDFKILDFATNGVAGDIARVIEKYNLKKIYFHSPEKSALLSFLDHPSQPFATFRHLFIPTTCMSPSHVISYCPYRKEFCSLCKAFSVMIGCFQENKPKLDFSLMTSTKPLSLNQFNTIQNTFRKKITVRQTKPAFVNDRYIKKIKRNDNNFKLYSKLFKTL